MQAEYTEIRSIRQGRTLKPTIIYGIVSPWLVRSSPDGRADHSWL